jgi:hypothetical protein
VSPHDQLGSIRDSTGELIERNPNRLEHGIGNPAQPGLKEALVQDRHLEYQSDGGSAQPVQRIDLDQDGAGEAKGGELCGQWDQQDGGES